MPGIVLKVFRGWLTRRPGGKRCQRGVAEQQNGERMDSAI